MSNHLLVQLQRQYILLSYFKTLSVGPVWGTNPRPPAQQTGALPTELTRRRSGRRFNKVMFWTQRSLTLGKRSTVELHLMPSIYSVVCIYGDSMDQNATV